VITGDGKVGWRARLVVELSLIDTKTLWGAGAALLVVAALGAAANALDLGIAGDASMLVSVAAADLGLALLALGWLAPSEPASPASADESVVRAAKPAAATSSSDVRTVEPEPVAVRRKAGSRAGARLQPADDKRYRELAVFAGRGPIPPSALEALWGSQGLSSERIARFADQLVERSLVQRGNDGALIVDEQSGAIGAGSVTGRRNVTAAHGRLVDGYRSRCPDGSWSQGPNDGYFFENIAYHLAQANRARDLNRLLLDYDWLRAKLAVAGIIRLLADFACQPLPPDVEAVDRALVLSAACLAARPDRLASQLTGRLGGLSSPGIDGLLDQVRDRAPRPWICPLAPAPTSPGKSRRSAIPRHDGAVRALAVTPDGSRLVTGGDDHAIRIWNLASGRLERTLQGHLDSVRAVAVTPDGRRIISGGTYDVVRVWDLASGQFEHTIATQAGCRAVYAVAVTKDGKRVVWGGAGSSVQVWDLASGRAEHTLTSRDGTVRAVAITPDGRFALSGGDGGTVQVWDLETGLLVRALKGYARPVLAVAVTPDGSRVVSGGHDNTVQVWDLESGRLERTLWGHTGPVDAVAVTPDGRRIVSGGLDRKVRMWDLSDGREIASWSPESDPESDPELAVMAFCAIPADSPRVAYGDSAGSVRVLGLLEA
jgi:hypothetical protein